MKLPILLGALIISASPVQASETFKQITQPCKESEEAQNACDAMAIHFGTMSYFSHLCRLEQFGKVTPEMFPGNPKIAGKTERGKETGKVAFNSAVRKIKNEFPNCPIKYIP
tara:strand:+ start:498 stop:833 length:336 start_codon:yes stop_codon:yes gene_type:complete